MPEHDAMRWLQLTYKVPSEPSQKRVWVWRRLQNLGAYALQNSVYLLPHSEEVEKHFTQLAHDIQELGGEASLFFVVALDAADERRILQALLDARNSEYSAVVQTCSQFLSQVASALQEPQEETPPSHETLSDLLEKVHSLFRSARRHDLLGNMTATRRAMAAEALMLCEQLFRVSLERDHVKARRVLERYQDTISPLPDPTLTKLP
ncbi:Chromate resistance protein ChrB [Ktedonobacter racemifer]|uniref:ChrB domain-containing protein n=1 Tax=Ktedonobacter racemifer DSM 44963 TaxID=485913 RepID=D6THH8_KTERA|nr:Chromate resistance protein ChrB [Ktedonobacter racemifer]EFH88983.1 ChrB domain-containing protein [Ktedonobacter racemifer DSM 44963]